VRRLDRRATAADNSSMAKEPINAIYVPPSKVRAQRARAMTKAPPPTYRLKLERVAADGKQTTVHQWSGIPHYRVKPILETLESLLPWLARAAGAREALRKLAELFH
jgi:hypothetical protein